MLGCEREMAEEAEGEQNPSSTTYNVHSETCVWDLVVCDACKSGQGEERIILCDGCDLAYHLECATPSLDEIPEGEWYCMLCTESIRREDAEPEQKAQEMCEEKNFTELERRARGKLLLEQKQDPKLCEEQDETEREKQHEREERQRKAREHREKRLDAERLAKEKERERKLQQERDRKAKEQRYKEKRAQEEKEERERKLKEKEAEREHKAKAQADKEAASAEDKGLEENKEGKKEGDGMKGKKSEVRTPRGPKASLSTYSAADAAAELAELAKQLKCCAPIDCSDWDVADDDDGKTAWNQKLKHTWYGGPGMEWLSKETLRCLWYAFFLLYFLYWYKSTNTDAEGAASQDLDVGTNRKLPCTKITVAKSKQQLIGTLERWCEEHYDYSFSWVEEQHVPVKTLQAVCADLCINAGGHSRFYYTVY
jgi:hypothetical protein